MEIKYTYEGSAFFTDDELNEIANRSANKDNIHNILEDLYINKYGYDDRYIDEIEYIEDDVKKYIEEHYDLSDGKTIKWLINCIHNHHRIVNINNYNIYCNYDYDANDNITFIRIIIGVDSEISNRVKIFIDNLSNGQFEVIVVDGDEFYISKAKLYDKISSINGLNKYKDILALLDIKNE